MGLLKKKPDPISEKAKSLNAQIAALEHEIRRLDSQLQTGPEKPPVTAAPRWRSTTLPQGAAIPHAPAAPEPIFEADGQEELKAKQDPPATPQHFNELGVRKYDLASLFRRVRPHLYGPSSTSPKLVNLLAAGSVQGLRPLRYEKRVARNRFLALFAFFFLALLGIIAVFVRNH